MKTIIYPFLLLLGSLGYSGCSSASHDQPTDEFYLFIGTYTGAGSEGIYVYRFNSSDGSVDSVSAATGVENPSFLALSPDGSNLYAVNEIGDSTRATVSAFSFDKQEGRLRFLNKQSSHGGAPCYVSVDKTGRAVFAGNYAGGSLAMFPVQEDGSLGKAKTVIEHRGSSVNEERQNSPHVHYTQVTPDNNLLLVNDLGTDRLTAYPFEQETLTLDKQPAFTIETAPGTGPRHLAFHPNGQYAYLINELNGTIDAFRYKDQKLTRFQTVSTLPDDYNGPVSGADIHLSPDGQFLYATNREELNNIVIYNVDPENGRLTQRGTMPSGGEHPRNFMIDPTGKYLLVANRHTDNIVIFRRNKETGMLISTGTRIKISQPVNLQMVPVK